MKQFYFKKASSTFLALLFICFSGVLIAQEHTHKHAEQRFYEIPDKALIEYETFIRQELSIANEEEGKKFKNYLIEQGVITYIRQEYSEQKNANQSLDAILYLKNKTTAIKNYYSFFKRTEEKKKETQSPVISNSDNDLIKRYNQVTRTMAACTNPGFETGDCTGWTMQMGQSLGSAVLIGGQSYNEPSNIVAATCGDGQHTIVTPGNDPVLGAALTTTAPANIAGGGGSYSLLLGNAVNGSSGTDAPSASQTFMVTPNVNDAFTIRYACVLNDPTATGAHPDAARPYFKISVKDQNGVDLVCGQYYATASSSGTGADPSFLTASVVNSAQSNSAILYKPWTAVTVPLTAQWNQNVTITCTVSDCAQGGHFGYAYIDCICGPLGVVSSSPAICGSNTISIAAPQGAVSYAWTTPAAYTGPLNNYGLITSAPGNYSVHVVTDASNAACSYDIDTSFAGSPSAPSANFTAPPVCAGTATQFTDISTPLNLITQWQWDFNNDAITDSTSQNPSYIFPSAGTYPVKLSITWPPCVADTVINVVVNPGPTATTNANSPCVGQNLNLTGGPAGMTSYAWTGPNSFSAPNTQSPTINFVTAAAAGTYTLTVTDVATGCSDTDMVVVNINPSPLATATANSPCVGQTLNLTGGPAGMTSYAWSGPSSYADPGQSPTRPTATAAFGGIYTLTVTNAAGCSDTAMVNVTVHSLPVATASSNAPCLGTTLNFSGGPNGMQSYSWTGPHNYAVQNPSIASVTAGDAGLYTLTVTSLNNCQSTATLNVALSPSPVANAGADAAVCAGNNATLTGSGAGAGGSYSWLTNAGVVSASSNVTAAPLTNTWYELTVTDAAGCKDKDSAKIIVNPLPVVNFTNTTICQGDSTRFTNTSADTSGGAFTSFWSFGNAGGNTSNLTNPSLLYNACGNFNVTLIVTTDSSCQDATTKSITVNCVPTAAFSTANVCYPAAATFNNTSAVSGGSTLSYNWDYNYIAPVHASDFITSANNAANSYTDGTYVVNLIATTPGGCADTISHSVTVYPKPTADFSTNNVCLHQATNFTDLSAINAPDNIATWQWDYNYVAPPPFTFDYTAATGTGASNIYPNLSATNAALVVTSNNGCKDTVIHPITIYPIPVPSFTVPPVCLNTTSVFTNNSTISSGSISSYNWEFDTLAGGPSSGVISPTNNYTASGSFPVQLTATSNFGCVHDTVIYAVVYPNPVVDFVTDINKGCEPLCINLTDLSTISPTPPGSVNSTFSWVFGDGDVATGANQAHCYQNDGSYDVTLTVTSNFNCTTTLIKPAYITVYPNPVADFSVNPDRVDILNPNIVVIDLSSGADFVSWNFGDSTTQAQSSNNENMNHTYADTGCYTITQVVTTIYGCTDSTVRPVCVDPEFIFYIPNAFTPNGDGKNDLFNGKGIGIIKYELLVFDRWGELINRTETLKGGWDGTKTGNGDLCQTDVYVWKVNLVDVFNRSHKYIGSVTLLK